MRVTISQCDNGYLLEWETVSALFADKNPGDYIEWKPGDFIPPTIFTKHKAVAKTEEEAVALLRDIMGSKPSLACGDPGCKEPYHPHLSTGGKT